MSASINFLAGVDSRLHLRADRVARTVALLERDAQQRRRMLAVCMAAMQGGHGSHDLHRLQRGKPMHSHLR